MRASLTGCSFLFGRRCSQRIKCILVWLNMKRNIIRKNAYILIVLSCCISCNGGPSQEKKLDKKAILKDVQSKVLKYLKEVGYDTETTIKNNSVIIEGLDTYSSNYRGNAMLLDYVIHRYCEENDSLPVNVELVVNYKEVTKTSGQLKSTDVLESRDAYYWEFIKHAIRTINISDCVYYKLTSKITAKENNYKFKGEIWDLIQAIALHDKDAEVSFLHFYTWSAYAYSDSLDFDQSKLDFYLEKMGYNKSEVNDSLVDKLYRDKGWGGVNIKL